MKKIYQVSITFLLLLFSFFYTNQVIKFIRSSDPIMQQIKNNSKNYKTKAVDAQIDGVYIKPGISGKEVNYDKSFQNMKRYGTYNESLTVFSEISPSVSIDDYYDKFILEGSGVNNDVSLVFIVKAWDNPTNIVNILYDSGVTATFFVDGLWLDNNRDLAEKMLRDGHELEILSYDNKYDEIYFSSSLNTLSKYTNISPKYCFAKYDDKNVLELCEKFKLHTIIPTITTGNFPFNEVKKKLRKGSIISFDIITSTEIELKTVIDYIMQRGYIIDRLDVLLSESVEEK